MGTATFARLRRSTACAIRLAVPVLGGALLMATDDASYPPELPGGVKVVTDCSPEFIRRPEGFEDAIDVAKAPPTIEFLYYPGQDYPGRPWSVWGDGLAVSGKYYSSIGDHLAPRGNAFVYEYDPETKSLRILSNVQKTLDLPEGHYTPGKIHSRIDLGPDGWLYFGTHRGSTRVTTDEHHYEGDWILRCHAARGETEIVARGPVPKHCIPTSVLDPERLIFYGGTAAGNLTDPVMFFAYDIRQKKVLHTAVDGPYRYLIFARSTGRVYYVAKDGGPLMRYDPRTGNPPKRVPGSIGIRSATAETPDGFVYTVSTRGDATLWRFDSKTETVERIGNAAVGGVDYVTSLDADPTGRFLYYVPGAHGGGPRVGSPLVQFDVQTGKKKIIAFLHPFYATNYGYTPLGTFASAVDPRGDRVYITWNGNRGGPDTRGRVPFDTCALTVVHIPETERRAEQPRPAARTSPFVFRDIAREVGLGEALRGVMAHAAAWGDVDGDSDLDLFVGTFADRPLEDYVAGGARGPVPNRLLVNRNGRLELSQEKTIGWKGRASGAVFADLDGDRRPELYVANNGRTGKENQLYRNRGNGDFQNITHLAGGRLDLPETARSATVLDFDGDGRLDILVLGTSGKGETMLFRNLGGLKFERSDALPGDACGLGVAACDVTGNGWPDVMVGGLNRLFVNQGEGRYREATELGLSVDSIHEDDSASCGVAFGDVNRDGRPDMLIGSHRKRPWREPTTVRLLLNRGSTPDRARFEDVTERAGIVKLPMKMPHVEIRDFDNDGWPDLYTSVVVHAGDAVHPAIFRNLGADPGGVPRFTETAFVHRPEFPGTEDLGPPGPSAVFYDRLVERRRVMYFAPGPSADFDGDGRLDLFLGSWFPRYPSLLLRNETPGGHFVDVELVGSGGVNSMGVGAVVRAYRAGSAREPEALIASEEIAAAYGYTSGQPPVAHLGLGDVGLCDIVVTLPHGRGEVLRQRVRADGRIAVQVRD